MSNSNGYAWTPIDFEIPLKDQVAVRLAELQEVIGDWSSEGWPAVDLWAYSGYLIYSINEEYAAAGRVLQNKEIKDIVNAVGRVLRASDYDE